MVELSSALDQLKKNGRQVEGLALVAVDPWGAWGAWGCGHGIRGALCGIYKIPWFIKPVHQ